MLSSLTPAGSGCYPRQQRGESSMVRLSVLIATLAIAAPVFAQPDAPVATVSGVVRDSSGGEVPGVIVRIVAEGSGAAVEAVTDAGGRYQSPVLVPGPYRVEIVLDGFAPALRQVTVAADRAVTSDVSLNPARLSEGVVVTARRVEEVAQEVPIPL